MTGQEIIDYIQNNKLENEYELDCELKFDVRLKDGSRLGYELNDFSDNMVEHYDFTEDGPRLIQKVTLEEALKLRGETTPFRCKAEESGWQDASACKDCQNKCDEYHQWDKETKMADYYKEFCSKCKYKDVDEHDSPCKECADAFFDDWKNPKRKFGKYFEKINKR